LAHRINDRIRTVLFLLLAVFVLQFFQRTYLCFASINRVAFGFDLLALYCTVVARLALLWERQHQSQQQNNQTKQQTRMQQQQALRSSCHQPPVPVLRCSRRLWSVAKKTQEQEACRVWVSEFRCFGSVTDYFFSTDTPPHRSIRVKWKECNKKHAGRRIGPHIYFQFTVLYNM